MSDIREKNVVIARWMGHGEIIQGQVSVTLVEDNLRYDRDWNLLMEVYLRCYSIWRENFKNDENCDAIFENIWQALWKGQIDVMHREIVEFIEWVNKKKEENER